MFKNLYIDSNKVRKELKTLNIGIDIPVFLEKIEILEAKNPDLKLSKTGFTPNRSRFTSDELFYLYNRKYLINRFKAVWFMVHCLEFTRPILNFDNESINNSLWIGKLFCCNPSWQMVSHLLAMLRHTEAMLPGVWRNNEKNSLEVGIICKCILSAISKRSCDYHNEVAEVWDMFARIYDNLGKDLEIDFKIKEKMLQIIWKIIKTDNPNGVSYDPDF